MFVQLFNLILTSSPESLEEKLNVLRVIVCPLHQFKVGVLFDRMEIDEHFDVISSLF